MNFGGDWRQRRNLLNTGIHFGPMHYTISNYSTDVQMDKKIQIDEINSSFGEGDLLNRFHSIPDPLKKNLADSVITAEVKNKKTNKMSLDMKDFCYESDVEADEGHKMPEPNRNDFYPTLTGIAGFFTNVLGAISGAMFHRRPKSPTAQYFDCFDQVSADRRQGSPRNWRPSKMHDQNKNGRAQEQFSTPNDNMNNCKSAAAHCEGKLNAVRSLLTSKSVPIPPKTRLRRPRRQFVEPSSVEDGFEDAFAPEDFMSLANEEYIEYFSVNSSHTQETCEVDAPKVKTEVAAECKVVNNVPEINSEKSPKVNKEVKQCTEIVKNIPEITKNIPETVEESSVNAVKTNIDCKDTKQEIISSCEDKIARLKSLLQEKCKKTTRTNLNSTNSAIEPVKEEMVVERLIKPRTIPTEKRQDKRFKNPHRLSKDKRRKSQQRKNIHEDALFAHEIDSEELSSVENSPKHISSLHRLSEETKVSTESLGRLSDKVELGSVEEKEYFDEFKGRFHSSSTTESEDSFQIVFTDSPKLSRVRRQSDCESEDSFIVFEESPDSCYTSNDVFGEQTEESECDSDSGSDVSDSGCAEVCKLSHSYSRTVSDLTDDSLYDSDRLKKLDRLDSDEVDCAVATVCEEIPAQELKNFNDGEGIEELEPVKRGLLLDEARKRKKKDQPTKRVSFCADPPRVHVMRVWTFAARQARAGHWERHALDRDRFKRRIADVDMAVAWVLKPQHRSRVMFQRFMPWWNAQKRIELAEKKIRDEQERVRIEAERIHNEEEEKLRAEAERDMIEEAECKKVDQLAAVKKLKFLKAADRYVNRKNDGKLKTNTLDKAKGKEINNSGLDTSTEGNENNTNVESNNVHNNIQANIIPNDNVSKVDFKTKNENTSDT